MASTNIITLVEQNLCVADMEDFQEEFEMDLLEAIDGLQEGTVKLDTKVLTGLIWIAKRHEDPDFTVEQARHFPVMQLNVDTGTNPTRAALQKSGGNKRKPVKKSVSKRS